VDHDRDVLGEEHDDDVGEDEPRSSVLPALRAPEALALASLVLAGVSVLGLGLLNGSPYLPPSFEGPPQSSSLVQAALLGAALALVPAALGVLALRRLPDDAPSRAVAGAGVLVALVSCVLRLVLAVRASTDDATPFLQF
jgi:hypothetical protein